MATIFEKQTITGFTFVESFGLFEAGITPPPFIFIIDKKYEIEWDGNTYVCKAQDLSAAFGDGVIAVGNLSSLGGEGNDEPFIIACSASGVSFFSAENSESHEVGVYEYIEAPQGIVLRNYHVEDVVYAGIETITFGNTDGEIDTFTRGIAVEDVPITLDFSGGNQIVTATDGYLVKSAVIEKPETLIPENIRINQTVAGIPGSFIGEAEEKTVDLNMAGGDMIITPSENMLFSSVTIKKPETYVPENIADGVNVGGVIGTHQGGESAKEESVLNEDPWIDDVCFWDLEGNLILNVPMNQILNLTELPTAPSYENMIFEGWNHTLDEIKSTTYPLDIAPIYSTDDGKTHIKITPYSASYLRFQFNFSQTVENGVSFDFGDGSTAETASGTGVVYIQHTFPSAGKEYEVVISVSDGCVLALGGGTTTTPIVSYSTTSNSYSAIFRSVKDLRIANGVELNAHGLKSLQELEFLSLPKTLTAVPSYNLNTFSSIRCIAIPRGVTNIENYSIYSIGGYNYKSAESIISLPQTVKTLGTYSLYIASFTKRIVVPRGIVELPNYCVGNFNRVKRAFFDGENIKSIGSNFLFSCELLSNCELPKAIESIPDNCFTGNIVENVNIPPSVKTIGNYFLQYSALKSVNIPPSVTTIGNHFLRYSSLKDIFIPSSVTTIGTYALSDIYTLRRIIVEDGSKLTSVGSSFLNTTKSYVQEVIFLSSNLPTSAVFKNLVNYIATPAVYVPDDAVEAYKNLAGTTYFYDIKPLSEYNGTIPNYND